MGLITQRKRDHTKIESKIQVKNEKNWKNPHSINIIHWNSENITLSAYISSSFFCYVFILIVFSVLFPLFIAEWSEASFLPSRNDKVWALNFKSCSITIDNCCNFSFYSNRTLAKPHQFQWLGKMFIKLFYTTFVRDGVGCFFSWSQ